MTVARHDGLRGNLAILTAARDQSGTPSLTNSGWNPPRPLLGDPKIIAALFAGFQKYLYQAVVAA